VKERRRGVGSWRSRERWTPQDILPKESSPGESNKAAEFNSSQMSTGKDQGGNVFDSNGAFRLESGMPPYSSHSSLSNIGLSQSERDPLSDALVDAQLSFINQSEEGFDFRSLASSFPSTFDDMSFSWWPTLVAPLSPPQSAFHVTLPNSMVLTTQEHNALHHYQTSLLKCQTTKATPWSTMTIFLRLASSTPMIMHLLLAVSLAHLALSQEDDLVVWGLVQQHFRSGTRLLAETINNDTGPDHCTVMAAFWFLYLAYNTQWNKGGLGRIRWLSKAVVNYVKRHDLYHLYTVRDPISSTALEGRSNLMSARDLSLLARVMIWIFYADAVLSFLLVGGDLAAYFWANEQGTDAIFKSSQFALPLFFGSEYPDSECIDDVENSMALELYYKIMMIVQELNNLAVDGTTRKSQHKWIEDKLDALEEVSQVSISSHIANSWRQKSYNSIFHLAAKAISPRTRLLQNIDWIVSHSHAARIYNYRCLVAASNETRPATVQNSVSSLLRAAHRAFASGIVDASAQLQWPLFVAGLETQDPIHQDWILGKLVGGKFHAMLEAVLNAQQQAGGRISIHSIRNICCDNEQISMEMLVS
jgi:Fungal specific transcription factor domain